MKIRFFQIIMAIDIANSRLNYGGLITTGNNSAFIKTRVLNPILSFYSGFKHQKVNH